MSYLMVCKLISRCLNRLRQQRQNSRQTNLMNRHRHQYLRFHFEQFHLLPTHFHHRQHHQFRRVSLALLILSLIRHRHHLHKLQMHQKELTQYHSRRFHHQH